MTTLNDIIKQCDGIVLEDMTSGSGTYARIYAIADPVLPENDYYIQINQTATKGTIGKLVGLKVKLSDKPELVMVDGKPINAKWVHRYSTSYIIQIEGRKGTNKINNNHAVILDNYTGPTIYKRTVSRSRPKEIIPPHVNKYGQTLKEGEWIVGSMTDRVLVFGEVMRWTKTSVFVSNKPEDKTVKHKCINRPRETLIFPGDAESIREMMTMMILSGVKF